MGIVFKARQICIQLVFKGRNTGVDSSSCRAMQDVKLDLVHIHTQGCGPGKQLKLPRWNGAKSWLAFGHVQLGEAAWPREL